MDIVSAYGVRCILNEVALEQLSPARLAEACEDAISELPAMLKPRPRGGRGDVKPEPPSRVAIARRAHRRVREGFREAVPLRGRRAAGRGRRVEWRGF